MSSPKVQRVRRSWLRSLAVVVMAPPAFLCGQAPPTQSTGAVLGQQFAEIGESLTTRADALLLNADQPVVVGVVRAEGGGVSDSGLTIPPKPERTTAKNGGLGSSFARVELLRPTIDPILRGEGVPVEMAAVVLVESGGNSFALSPKGARGLWQLMPYTARRYGLVVDGTTDERVDIQKSTHAAARYLSDLHLQFGSWPLALAAYNTGEQNLQRAIDRSRSLEFTVLSSSRLLPTETRNYVPAVMAAMRSFGQPHVLGDQNFTPPAITVFAASSQ